MPRIKLICGRFDAIRKARDWVASLDWAVSSLSRNIPHVAFPPRHSLDDLFSFIDPDIRKPFDMKEVLIRIVDDSRYLDFKPEFGRNLMTVWATVHGKIKGIVYELLS